MTAPENETELAEVVEDPDAVAEPDDGPAWPVAWYRLLRHWLARGRVRSKYWVPRVGDRVRLHGCGTWLVYAVWIRRGEVQLGGPGIQALADIGPALREDLDKLYGSQCWDLPPELSVRVVTPKFSEPDPGPEKNEDEPPRLRAVPDLDDAAGDGREVEFE